MDDVRLTRLSPSAFGGTTFACASTIVSFALSKKGYVEVGHLRMLDALDVEGRRQKIALMVLMVNGIHLAF